MDRKAEEFRNLTQGNMTVEAYQREFLNLSRYAEDEITTDARKQQKFCVDSSQTSGSLFPFMTLIASPPW